MRAVLTAFLIGTASSLFGAYAYAATQAYDPDWEVVAGIGLAIFGVTWAVITQRFRLFILTSSGVTAYYPKGQKSYLPYVIKDLRKAENIKIIGARGLDLVGDQSPVGKVLRELSGKKNLEVFLLGADSEYGRLRSNYLEIERQKYAAESISAQHSVNLLQRELLEVSLFTYDAPPRVRAIIADNVAYVSSYKSGTRGRSLPAYRIVENKGVGYEVISAYLDHLRSISTKINIDEYMSPETSEDK